MALTDPIRAVRSIPRYFSRLKRFYLCMQLFYVLERIVALFSRAHLYNIFHIINKDLAVADVPCIKHLLCSLDDTAYWHLADHNVQLDLR